MAEAAYEQRTEVDDVAKSEVINLRKHAGPRRAVTEIEILSRSACSGLTRIGVQVNGVERRLTCTSAEKRKRCSKDNPQNVDRDAPSKPHSTFPRRLSQCDVHSKCLRRPAGRGGNSEERVSHCPVCIHHRREKTMASRSLTIGICVAALILPATVLAQGSAGTGNTSTGIGAPYGLAGPGIRGDGTQQPGSATNTTGQNLNVTPAQRNSVPPANMLPRDARGYRR